MHWSLKQIQIQYQHQKMQDIIHTVDKYYSDEHKHCTMQTFDTTFGGDRGADF